MGCGCKKRRADEAAAAAAQRVNNVVIVEGQSREGTVRPPDVLKLPPPPVPTSDVESIVNKLNNILNPS